MVEAPSWNILYFMYYYIVEQLYSFFYFVLRRYESDRIFRYQFTIEKKIEIKNLSYPGGVTTREITPKKTTK